MKPLTGTIPISNYTVRIRDVIGRGAACICYDVEAIEQMSGISHKMILKEFFPKMLSAWTVEREGLFIKTYDSDCCREICKLYQNVQNAYELQSTLANQPETMGVVVKPVHIEGHAPKKNESGNVLTFSLIALYEANWGDSLEKIQENSLKESLLITQRLADALSRIHKQGVLLMDLKPENILYIDRGTSNASIRLFQKLLKRYPSKQDTEQSLKKELESYFQYTYRKKLNGEQQSLLIFILYHSSAYSMRQRYTDAKLLADDVQKLIDSIQDEPLQVTTVGQVSYSMLSAGVIDRNPLYWYSDQNRLDAVLVGHSPMREAFFETIFSCCQMLDRELHIHIPESDCMGTLCGMLKKYPTLGKTVQIVINETEYKVDGYDPADTSIVTEKLAYLHFYSIGDADGQPMTADALKQLLREQWQHCRYFLLTDVDADQNYQLAQQLAAEQTHAFIGYCDDRGDGYDLRKLLQKPNNSVHHEAIGMDANYSQSEHCFEQQVMKRALEIHKHYCGAADDEETHVRMEREFLQGSSYNIRSSIRSALAIPYEVRSIGIDPAELDAGMRFEREICEQNVWNRLLWLEHRSWCAFMITDGARRPTEAQLYAYAFRNGNDQKNKAERLHPCLCASRAQGIELEAFTDEEWLTCDISGFDPLDQMSLLLHRHCYQQTQKICLDDYFALLAEKTGTLACSGLIAQLKPEFEKLRARQPNQWKPLCRTILEQVDGLHIPMKLMECICEEASIVEEYAKRHDYKKSDADILKAVPKLL